MPAPMLLAVDGDPDALGRVERELRDRYTSGYRSSVHARRTKPSRSSPRSRMPGKTSAWCSPRSGFRR